MTAIFETNSALIFRINYIFVEGMVLNLVCKQSPVSEGLWGDRSQHENVPCRVAHIKQCYCLSYRMWIRILVVVLFWSICWILLNKAPETVCLSLHCHSLPHGRIIPQPHNNLLKLIFSSWSVGHRWTQACTPLPMNTQNPCSEKG